MTPVHYFPYLLLHTNLNIVKLALLEIRLNKLSRNKEAFKTEVGRENYDQKKMGCL